MTIRKANTADLAAICALYDEVHTAEENGIITSGWKRGIYPTKQTANAAILRGDMFILVDCGKAAGTAIINRLQPDVYGDGDWQYTANENEVMVLHTLAISPSSLKRGYGRKFVEFYESYARERGCKYLRMDTNANNSIARAVYKKLGYTERGTVKCEFNGISGVCLVLLEKKL